MIGPNGLTDVQWSCVLCGKANHVANSESRLYQSPPTPVHFVRKKKKTWVSSDNLGCWSYQPSTIFFTMMSRASLLRIKIIFCLVILCWIYSNENKLFIIVIIEKCVDGVNLAPCSSLKSQWIIIILILYYFELLIQCIFRFHLTLDVCTPPPQWLVNYLCLRLIFDAEIIIWLLTADC